MPFIRPTTPTEYDPALLTRFFRSQHSKSGELEIEEYYRPSSVISGWSASRPFPNLIPIDVSGPRYIYNLPSGPTQPIQLLQQSTVPPTFPAGDFRMYLPGERLSPLGSKVSGGGTAKSGCCCHNAEEQSSIFALGIKKILPELATAIGVQTARANVQQVHSRPASIDPPIRSFDFAEVSSSPTSVSDNSWVAIVTFNVPVGLNAVVKQVGIEAETPSALTDLQFRITVNGIPSIYLSGITGGEFASFSDPLSVTVKAIEQQRVALEAKGNTPFVTHFVRGLMRGWTFQPSLMANLDTIHGWRGQ